MALRPSVVIVLTQIVVFLAGLVTSQHSINQSRQLHQLKLVWTTRQMTTIKLNQHTAAVQRNKNNPTENQSPPLFLVSTIFVSFCFLWERNLQFNGGRNVQHWRLPKTTDNRVGSQLSPAFVSFNVQNISAAKIITNSSSFSPIPFLSDHLPLMHLPVIMSM